MKMAHLIIDVQNRYFAPRDLSKVFSQRNGADPSAMEKEKLFDALRIEMANRIAKFAEICREHDVPNIYVMHDISTLDAPQIDPKSLGAKQMTPALLNAPYIIAPDREKDIIISKRHFDAFSSTKLQETLERLGVEGLFVTGGILNYCVEHTCDSALSHGYHPVMLRDMVAPHLFDLNADALAIRYSEQEAYGTSSGLSPDIAPMLGVNVDAMPPLSDSMQKLYDDMEQSHMNETSLPKAVVAEVAAKAKHARNAARP